MKQPPTGKPRRVIVCGSRDWNAYLPIRREMEKLPQGSVVIHGAARGADSLASIAAKALKLEAIPYPVTPEEWQRLGASAGPIRNQRMLDEGKPDLVLAFAQDLESSKGTRDMVTRARAASVETKTFTS